MTPNSAALAPVITHTETSLVGSTSWWTQTAPKRMFLNPTYCADIFFLPAVETKVNLHLVSAGSSMWAPQKDDESNHLSVINISPQWTWWLRWHDYHDGVGNVIAHTSCCKARRCLVTNDPLFVRPGNKNCTASLRSNNQKGFVWDGSRPFTIWSTKECCCWNGPVNARLVPSAPILTLLWIQWRASCAERLKRAAKSLLHLLTNHQQPDISRGSSSIVLWGAGGGRRLSHTDHL